MQQGPRNGFLITERRGDRFGKEQKSLWWGRLIMIVKRGNDPKRTGPLTGRHTRIMKSYSVIRHQTVQRGETGRGGAGLRAHSVGSGECRTGRWR